KAARGVGQRKPEVKDVVTPAAGEEDLGPQKFFREVAERTDRSGAAIGLAWTQSGGDSLFVEATRMRGRGTLNVTGHLGEVMKESVQAAVSYIRSNARKLGVAEHLFNRSEFHVHVPAGRLPKRGPTEGATVLPAPRSHVP